MLYVETRPRCSLLQAPPRGRWIDPFWGNNPEVAEIQAAPLAIIGSGGLLAGGVEVGVAAYMSTEVAGIASAAASGALDPGPGGASRSGWEAVVWFFSRIFGVQW